MDFDISSILDNWEYESGPVSVRRFVGNDGMEKLQLRVDLGLLQMNVEGRPDGRRPHNFDTIFDFQLSRLREHIANHGDDADFQLDAAACMLLKQEAIQYHHRYICLLELKDFDRVIRDAKRNIKVFDFVEKYAAEPSLSWDLNLLRPQLLMMKTRALAELRLKAGGREEAIEIVEAGIEDIREFYTDHDRIDLLEESNEIFSLSDWREELSNPSNETSRSAPTSPLSRKEQLELEMARAVECEDYERAAEVRDELRELENSSAKR